MLVDVIGNPLAKDDLVMVSRGDQQMYGIVLDISEPSLLAPGKDQMIMPGQIRIGLMPIVIPFDPRNPRLTDTVKVVKPPNFGKKES
jgi:hypothetical protein